MSKEHDSSGRFGDRGSSFPSPFSEDGVEALALRGRLAARLFGAPPVTVRIGRYEIIDRIGAGGMGVVYSAQDPDLGRLVALKVLSESRDCSPRHRQRLVDEARALARLSHPNVIQIYEVGESEGVIFLALELVEGQTLSLWQRESGRRWQEVLAAYLAAAKGLGAAHRVGVVHRDVKPSNILIGADGRVRVVDFGLANADLEESTMSSDYVATSKTRSTSVPGIAGTPDYMSPEQASGRSVDLRSDVFSLCVSLFEGLFGHRPFDYHDLRDLPPNGTLSVSQIRALTPRGSSVPAWVSRELTRGMQPDPGRRFASMEELICAFEQASRRRQRRWRVITGGLGVVLFGGTLVRALPGSPACPAVADSIPGVWDEHAREATRERFLASNLPFAERSWMNVADSLDALVAKLGRERRTVCWSTKVEGKHSDEYLDRASACLGRHELAIRALTDRLMVADARAVTEAHRLIGELRDPSECSDADALYREPVWASVGLREFVGGLRGRFYELRYLMITGQYGVAEERGEELVAASSIHLPTQAEALYLRGKIDAYQGAFREAEDRLRRAAALAERVQDDRLVAEILGELTRVATSGHRDLSDASLYADMLGAKLKRIDIKGELVADYHDSLGRIALLAGDPETSLAEYERAVSLREEEDAIGVAHSREGRANALAGLGDFDASIAELEEVRGLLRRELGAEHPVIARVDFNLARSLRERPNASPQDLERAAVLLRGALAVDVRHSGSDGLNAARDRVSLADVLGASGEVDEARGLLNRAMIAFEAMSSVAEVDRMTALALAINFDSDRRDWSAAAASTTALIRILRGRGEPLPSDLLINAGEFLIRADDPLAATAYFDEALTAAFAEGPDGILMIYALNGRAKLYLLQGDPGLARALYDRALDLLDAVEEPGADLMAEIFWGAAQALARTGGPRTEVLRLAREGYVLFAELDPPVPEMVAIERFLA
ncbi:MAG TPA: serine/threonine protein kinase, partial [Nannocystis exedens]|nr:serine/threonine protein kinase [Nannocystis exedens]